MHTKIQKFFHKYLKFDKIYVSTIWNLSYDIPNTYTIEKPTKMPQDCRSGHKKSRTMNFSKNMKISKSFRKDLKYC